MLLQHRAHERLGRREFTQVFEKDRYVKVYAPRITSYNVCYTKLLRMSFGRDGYLYISMGDGGYANDWGIGHNRNNFV